MKFSGTKFLLIQKWKLSIKIADILEEEGD